MGINMHIKDTYAVTMEELTSMLPNSKAAKQVDKLIAEIEQLRVQLAGCGVAAMCNTAESREKQKYVEGDFGWSQSYQDVVNAVGREIEYRELCDKLRDAIRRILDSPPLLSEIANEALQSESV